MDVVGLLEVAFAILDWVVDWELILCGMLFAFIMVKTLLDVSKKAIETSGPGLRNFLRWMRG